MFNPNIHHRRSIRLKEYDYSQEGVYFVTICTEKKECLFGDIVNGKMVLNDAGKIVFNEWLRTTEKRTNVELHEFVVMPNHFHAIIEITHSNETRGRGVLHTPNNETIDKKGVCNTPLRSPSQTVGAIVRGFKSAVSKQIGFSVWQRNYHEHIIRNGNSYQKIAEYIVANPANWADDKFYVAPK